MKYVEPEIFHIAQTTIDEAGLRDALTSLGAPDWSPNPRLDDASYLSEFAGRLCYKSFAVDPELNKNITKVRDDSKEYVGNIIKQKHGSVFEHASVTYLMRNVSRVLTHEEVRHRPGKAYSQESLRYVRLDNFRMYFPDCFKDIEDPDVRVHVEAAFAKAVMYAEGSIKAITHLLGLDDPESKYTFEQKKAFTSALRRIAPQGMATDLLVTGNHRAWRHEIQVRTANGAEEEIRKVFRMIADDLVMRYRPIYQDMYSLPDGTITFTNEKI